MAPFARALPWLAPCAATLVVTPASILRQWLSEIERHAPALAPRVLVYPGLQALGKAARPSRVARALDSAWLVLVRGMEPTPTAVDLLVSPA